MIIVEKLTHFSLGPSIQVDKGPRVSAKGNESVLLITFCHFY